MTADPFRVDPDGLDDTLADYMALNWAHEDFGDDEPRKIPKDPASPRRNAKSNDAATWGSFNDALANALENDDLGFGFPCAQPGHPFFFVDVDIPDGGEWVPDYDRLGGAVVERSPSGNHRVILRDVEDPEWWTNLSLPGENQPEVKLFRDTGYVTLTGDTLEGHGLPLEETNQPAFEKWLKEAWRAFPGTDADDPEPWADAADGGVEADSPVPKGGGDADTTTPDGDQEEWLTAADIREALEYINPDLGRDEWRNVGFGLAHFFDDATARRLFIEWSRRGTKWDEKAPDEAERIINDEGDRSPKRPRTIGTVVDRAKAGGWDMSTCPSALEASANTATADGDGGGGPADGGGGTASPIVERDDGYYKRVPDGDGGVDLVRLTNFTIRVDSLLTHDDGAREFHLEVVPDPDTGDDPYEAVVEPAVFNEPRTFKDEVVTGFSVWSDCGYADLNALRQHLAQSDAPRRVGTDTVGFTDDLDELVAPGGALTADGWSDDPTTVFTGNETAGWSLTPDRDEYDADAVADTLEQLPQTRTSERFLPVLGWFYTAPLAPLVRQWEGEFNILNVLGDTGAGKTATLEVLSELFGFDGDLPDVDGTPFPKMRVVAATTLPVVFDEYRPATTDAYRIDKFHSVLRTSTRGGVAERGRPDMSVDRYHLEAPVCVAGEQPIQGPAHERRTILTSFTRDDTEPGTASARAFDRLHDGADALEHHALAYYRWLAGRDPDDLRERWDDAEATVTSALSAWGLDGLDDLVVQGYVTVLFGCRLYRAFADDMGADAEAVGVTDDAALAAIDYLTDEGTGAEHVSHLAELLAITGRAIRADGYLERDEHYAIVNEGDDDERVGIDYRGGAFDKVTKYVRDHGVSSDLLDSWSDYEGRVRDAAPADPADAFDDDHDSPVVAAGINNYPVGWTPAFTPEAVFGAHAGEDDASAPEGASGGDDDGPGGDDPTDVHALNSGFQTLVATVSTVGEPAPWLAGEGVLFGDGGVPIRYHVKAADDAPADADDFDLEVGATYRFERAHVTSDRDGEQIVELIPGTTTAAALREPSSGGQAGLADGGDAAAAQDERIRQIITEVTAASANGDGIGLNELAGRLGANPSQLASDLDSLEESGRVIEEGGKYTRGR